MSLRVGPTAWRFHGAARRAECVFTCIAHEDSVIMHFVASFHSSRSRGLPETPEASRAAQDSARVSPAAPRVPTILIIEDEPTIARALKRLLMCDGYQVEVTTNGQEALTACERQEYTQILCDLWMPILDGQGFYQALSRYQPQMALL
jgi:PleD family two-component response regulator